MIEDQDTILYITSSIGSRPRLVCVYFVHCLTLVKVNTYAVI